MKQEYTEIGHDPESRGLLVRQAINDRYQTKDGCAFCGNLRRTKNPSLFNYGWIKDDDLSGRVSWDTKSFCSKACREYYCHE